jgi:hypothetical protein
MIAKFEQRQCQPRSLYLLVPVMGVSLLLLCGLGTAAPPPPASPAVADLDEVLISGEQPGPGLWKVSRGNHVLWILGRYGPLPRRMVWHSERVEAVIAQSQALLMPVNVHPEIGFFTGLTMLPSLMGIRDNPNGAKLKDLMPAALYGRWSILKARYIGQNDNVEKWRPIFAAHELYTKAVQTVGLEPQDVVSPVIDRLARKDHLHWITPTVGLAIEQPRAAVKEFKRSPLDDLECFEKTIARLEADLDLMRARANAWAVGDLAELRRRTPVDQASACIAAVLNSQLAQERGIQEVPDRMAAAWLAAAESALSSNVSTFAILPLDQLLKPDGNLTALRARGYTIEEP